MREPLGNRRQRPRARIALRAQCTYWSAEHPDRRTVEATLRDLSLTGARLAVPEPMAVGTSIELRFKTKLVGGRVATLGTVTSSGRELDQARVNVQFDAPLSQLEDFIEGVLLEEAMRTGGPLLGPVPEREAAEAPARAPRLSIALPVDCAIRTPDGSTATRRAVILSLSEAGARLCLLGSVERGAVVEFSFRLGLVSKRHDVRGSVQWSRRRGDIHEIGVALAQPVPAVAELIARGRASLDQPPPNDGGILSLLRDAAELGSWPPRGGSGPGRF